MTWFLKRVGRIKYSLNGHTTQNNKHLMWSLSTSHDPFHKTRTHHLKIHMEYNTNEPIYETETESGNQGHWEQTGGCQGWGEGVRGWGWQM